MDKYQNQFTHQVPPQATAPLFLHIPRYQLFFRRVSVVKTSTMLTWTTNSFSSKCFALITKLISAAYIQKPDTSHQQTDTATIMKSTSQEFVPTDFTMVT